MIKQVTSKKNLNAAYLQVYRNKGAGGIDKVQVTELKSILRANGTKYVQQIEEESYQVSPIKAGYRLTKFNF
jgi:RNA-directed DNA polymerase